MADLVIYNDGELELDVSIEADTLWLSQKQIADLFEVTKQNISLHIINIFKEKELENNTTVKFFLTVQQEGKRVLKIKDFKDGIENYFLFFKCFVVIIQYPFNLFPNRFWQ